MGRKGGSYPLQHLYGHFGLVRMCRLPLLARYREPSNVRGLVIHLGRRLGIDFDWQDLITQWVRLVGEQQEVFETAVGQNLRLFPAHRDTPAKRTNDIRHLAVFILRILAAPTQSRGVRDSKGALHHVRSTRPGFS
jgi:hypothetical protein